jgi:hypothetical protein
MNIHRANVYFNLDWGNHEKNNFNIADGVRDRRDRPGRMVLMALYRLGGNGGRKLFNID